MRETSQDNRLASGDLEGALHRAAADIVAEARRVLSDSGRTDAEVVHETRKALKRWRAFLRLLREPLGEQADRMRAEARELMRVLAGARDLQSALDALHDLRKADDLLSPEVLTATAERLTALRGAAERHLMTDALRGRIAHYLDEIVLALDRWPLEIVDADTVADALAASYRRARRRVPKHWAEADAERLHALRRRLAEHRHQIDLIAHLWPAIGERRAAEARRLRSRLGACQDMVVLARLAAPRQPLSRWRPQLMSAFAARRRAHLKAAARLAGRLFADKPKALRRRIAALPTDNTPQHAERRKKGDKPQFGKKNII